MFDIISINPTNSNFTEALLGAIVGGVFTLLGSFGATWLANNNETKIKKQEQEREEKAVVNSIKEEIKVLLELYKNDFEGTFTDKNDNNYIDSYYIITQNFMTIYENNSDKIGIIKDDLLRNNIIKAYTILKKFIEDLNIYKMTYENRNKVLFEFIKRANNEIYINSSLVIDEELESLYHFKDNSPEIQRPYDYNMCLYVKNAFNEMLQEVVARLEVDFGTLIDIADKIIIKVDEIYGDKNA